VPAATSRTSVPAPSWWKVALGMPHSVIDRA
jgi:hypothetical protein